MLPTPQEGRKYRYQGGISWNPALGLEPQTPPLMLGYPSLHLWEGLHRMLGLLCPTTSCGAGFGGSWSGCRALAVALASTGGSALNYSDEMGQHKSPEIFF